MSPKAGKICLLGSCLLNMGVGVMNVEAQLFSSLRELLPEGAKSVMIDLREGSSVADLMIHLGVDRNLGYSPQEIIDNAAWMVLVNRRYERDAGRTLHEGDQVQIVPWVAGG